MTAPHIDHIGIIVADLDESIALFERLFNVRPAVVKELHEVGLRIAQMKMENVDIELVQYMNESAGFARAVMGPALGINHIAVAVSNIDSSTKAFQEQGARLMDGFPRRGSHGQVAFFGPESTQDILIEICEHT